MKTIEIHIRTTADFYTSGISAHLRTIYDKIDGIRKPFWQFSDKEMKFIFTHSDFQDLNHPVFLEFEKVVEQFAGVTMEYNVRTGINYRMKKDFPMMTVDPPAKYEV